MNKTPELEHERRCRSSSSSSTTSGVAIASDESAASDSTTAGAMMEGTPIQEIHIPAGVPVESEDQEGDAVQQILEGLPRVSSNQEIARVKDAAKRQKAVPTAASPSTDDAREEFSRQEANEKTPYRVPPTSVAAVPSDLTIDDLISEMETKKRAESIRSEAVAIEELMASAAAMSIEEQESMPGGYAVRGPGLPLQGPGDEVVSRCNRDPHLAMEEGIAEGAAPTSQTRCSEASAHRGSSTTRMDSSDFLVEATLVSDASEEPVVQAAPLRRSLCHTSGILGYGILIFLSVLITSVIFGTVFSSGQEGDVYPSIAETQNANTTSSPTAAPLPTLERIRRDGFVRCVRGAEYELTFERVDSLSATRDQPFFMSNNFSTSFCSAIAAAVTGDPSAFEEVIVPIADELETLQNGRADLLISRTGITMQRDVFLGSAEEGVAQTMPYLYSGVDFAGVPAFVDCADDDIKTFGNCSDIKICIHESTSFRQDLMVRIPHRQIAIVNSTLDLFKSFLTGTCNVMATEDGGLSSRLLGALGYRGELAVGQRQYSTDMHVLTSLDSDPQWANFLNAVTMALLAAEQAGIVKETAEQIGVTDLFGEDYEGAFINAIKAVGNFGDLYTFPIERNGKNLVNDGTTGLLVSPPLGDIGVENRDYDNIGPVKGGTMESVLQRGNLRCGVRGGRDGFAVFNSNTSEWVGMDICFCTALAASLFDGEKQNVKFIDVQQRTEANGFVLLQDGVVDVFAGAMWTLPNTVREAVTGEGFSFSQPYFYGPVNDTSFDENLCTATRQTDPQWSSFVYWTTQSLVYAEEHSIAQRVSSQMPLVNAFGPDLKKMFRDAVHASGNYAELYDRHLERILPRNGRNRLHKWDMQGKAPLRYIPPGFDALDKATQIEAP